MGRQLGTVFADDTVIGHLRDVADGRAVARQYGDCTVAFLGRQRVGTQVVLVLHQGSVQFIAGVYEESRADDLRWPGSPTELLEICDAVAAGSVCGVTSERAFELAAAYDAAVRTLWTTQPSRSDPSQSVAALVHAVPSRLSMPSGPTRTRIAR